MSGMNVVGDRLARAKCSAAGGEIGRVMKQAVAYLEPLSRAKAGRSNGKIVLARLKRRARHRQKHCWRGAAV